MVIVMIGVIRIALQEGFCSMTTMFLLFVASVFIISAILHPKVNKLENILIIPPLPEGGGGYTVLPLFVRPSKIFFVTFFSVTDNGRNLIFGHKLHIGTPYRGKRFLTRQIPASCLPTLLIFINIEHICSFFIAFFSATIDSRNMIFGHKLHIGIPYRVKWRGYHNLF